MSVERRSERLFAAVTLAATAVPLAMLAVMIGGVFVDGFARLDPDFLRGMPSRHAEKAGVLPGLVGSVLLVTLGGAR